MIDDGNTDTGELTLAFSLSAIQQLKDPKAVFEDAQNWSQWIGLIDDDAQQIQQIVDEYNLRQDFDMEDRDKWFALEEICETTPTPRHVYVGANDEDMRVSTLFDWEYVRVTEAAKKADWEISETRSKPGIIARLLAPVRKLFE